MQEQSTGDRKASSLEKFNTFISFVSLFMTIAIAFYAFKIDKRALELQEKTESLNYEIENDDTYVKYNITDVENNQIVNEGLKFGIVKSKKDVCGELQELYCTIFDQDGNPDTKRYNIADKIDSERKLEYEGKGYLINMEFDSQDKITLCLVSDDIGNNKADILYLTFRGFNENIQQIAIVFDVSKGTYETIDKKDIYDSEIIEPICNAYSLGQNFHSVSDELNKNFSLLKLQVE